MPHKDPEAARKYFRERYIRLREQRLAYCKEYREKNAESVAAAKKRCYERIKDDPEYQKKRSEYQKERRALDRAHVREIERKSYYKNHKKRLATLRALSNTPERKARETVQRHIRNGKIPAAKTLQCVRCNGPAKEYHHHMGYERKHWLSVVPVCHQCHKDIHAQELIANFGSSST